MLSSAVHPRKEYCTPLFTVPILYQDDDIIILNKPSAMLSVPGKEVISMLDVKPRAEQWKNAVLSVMKSYANSVSTQIVDDRKEMFVPLTGQKRLLTYEGDKNKSIILDTQKHNRAAVVLAALEALCSRGDNVPRKEERFKRYLSRVCRIQDESLQMELFKEIQAMDDAMHRIPLDRIPEHLLSASDVASFLSEEYAKSKASSSSELMQPPAQVSHQVHHVHRLDMETSGVLMFAKNEHISSVLDAQFRNHEVCSSLNMLTVSLKNNIVT
jgi:hypothetical protein